MAGRIPDGRVTGPAAAGGRPAPLHVADRPGDNDRMNEWVMFATVAVIVGVLVVLLRMGVGDDEAE